MIIKINSIEKNKDIEFLAMVKNKIIGVSSNGKKYLTLELTDNTGDVSAKLWDADNNLDKLNPGEVYQFQAYANTFKNNIQLKINKFIKINEKDIEWSNFIKEAPINADVEYKFIIDTVNAFNNVNYKKVLLALLKKYENEFKNWPAASKFHHSVRKGLLWHTVSMLKVAKQLVKIYSIHKTIDFELLYAGAILHDLGKVIELELNGGIYEYSLRGKLAGHISIMNAELHCIAKALKLDETDDVLYLEHMILASHGKLEFGSPVLPALIEAEILSLLDNLDARIFSISDNLKITEKGTFTNRIMALEQRSFYNHYLDNNKK